MCPMLPQAAVAFEKLLERRRAIRLSPRPQDHVMRPGNGVDAVDLNKADPLDQVMQGLPRGGAHRGLGQGVSVQEKTAGAGVRDQLGHRQAVTLQSVSAKAGIVTKCKGSTGCKPLLRAYYPIVS
jgi:hypothetical protein